MLKLGENGDFSKLGLIFPCFFFEIHNQTNLFWTFFLSMCDGEIFAIILVVLLAVGAIAYVVYLVQTGQAFEHENLGRQDTSSAGDIEVEELKPWIWMRRMTRSQRHSTHRTESKSEFV